MAEDRPSAGDEPDPASLDGLHVHLVNFACEELWSMADDSEDENAEAYDTLAEQPMTAGGTSMNKDLMSWLRVPVPDPVYESLQREAQRVEWPFMCSDPGPEAALEVPPEEPMREHSKWAQLQDVSKAGCRAGQTGGKLRRLAPLQKRDAEIQPHDLIREAGELRFNDALLLVSQRLRIPITELLHEWDFEVDWQGEWGAREDGS